MSVPENKKELFGTDGVRGLANRFPMTVEIALALGKAAGVIFQSHSHKPRIVIGKDTRLSCYMFENALIAGLCSMGCDTLMVGPLPTPGVAIITRAYRADAGIVISASHNPYEDNGIKFFSSEGYKLPEAMEKEMEALVFSNQFESYLPPNDGVGRNTKIIDADGRYIEFVKGTFPRRLSLKNLKIAIDCANGAGYRVAPLVFQELDATVYVTGNTPNGLNINDGCGALHLENIQKSVIEHHADAGIAIDGDGDRLIMIDENAQIVNGDILLGICANDLKNRGKLQNNRIVGTVMSNLGLIKSMNDLGIEVVCSQVGDRYVLEEMIKHQASLGGEQSGHLIFLEYNTTGDALIAALQVLKIMIETDSKLSDLAATIQHYPQALISVKVKEKPPLDTLIAVQEAIKNAKDTLGDTGRVIVRYSGTEPLCRVMVESSKQKQAAEISRAIAKAITDAIGFPEGS